MLVAIIATTPASPPDFAQVRRGAGSSEAVLLARDGRELARRRTDADVRRLDWVPLGRISPALVTRIVASEDRRFLQHHGVDWPGVGGAIRDRLGGAHERGASTITMQLAALVDPALGTAGRRSFRQKVAQGRAALAIERRWNKQQILEAWLNLLPFRGDLVGVDAAARGLAGRAPAALDVPQSLVLTALARGPSASAARVVARACAAASILSSPLRGEATRAFARAGGGDRPATPALAVRGNTPTRADARASSLASPLKGEELISCAAVDLAAAAMLGPRAPLGRADLAPQLADRLLPPGTRGVVRTTIDADIQRMARDALARQLAALGPRNARDGAALVVDNATGDILAWVGSAGPASTAGAVDGASAPRQAGSTLKPQLYALAIERHLLTAASVLDDAPVDLDTASGLYIPKNYDNSYRGPVTVRSALGNSLNVPAVRALLLVGVDAFRDRLYDIGYKGITGDGDYYGFSLALGSAEVTLVEQAAAFRALARGGRWSALKVQPGVATPDRPIIDARAAAIVTDILSDTAARTATFGEDNGLALPFPAAVKTGTSKAMRDNWCIGFSDRFTVAVWVGNFEGDSMRGVSGVTGAAPAWRAIMLALHAGRPGKAFALPPGVMRSRVSFAPAIEPPRDELFLPGTVLTRVAVTSPTDARPRLLSPADGAVIALDPDIPPARQRVAVRATGGGALRVDGHPLGAGQALWPPVPGMHVMTLTDAGGTVLDRARITVR